MHCIAGVAEVVSEVVAPAAAAAAATLAGVMLPAVLALLIAAAAAALLLLLLAAAAVAVGLAVLRLAGWQVRVVELAGVAERTPAVAYVESTVWLIRPQRQSPAVNNSHQTDRKQQCQ
jgi:hypothetical protein